LNGEDPATGNARLSCANGCEIAFHVANVGECKQQCREGTGSCIYKPNWLEAVKGKPFFTCGVCSDPSCPIDAPYPSNAVATTTVDGNGNTTNDAIATTTDDARSCLDGCDHAATLPAFYTDRVQDRYYNDDNKCDGSTPDIPRFLFAGQSNMVGFSGHAKERMFDDIIEIINERRFVSPATPIHTNGNANNDNDNDNVIYSDTVIDNSNATSLVSPPSLPSGGVNRQRQRQLLPNKNKEHKEGVVQALENACNGALGSKQESSRHMAKRLYKLAGDSKTASILNEETILAPHPTSVCSFTNPMLQRDRGDGGEVLQDLACERPVTHEACGNDGTHYGPEFLFAHLFPKLTKTRYHQRTIGVTKVAVGGTKISQWVKPKPKPGNSGTDGIVTDAPEEKKLANDNDNDATATAFHDQNFWNALQTAIQTDHGTIEGFVWFQGESDHFATETPLEEYLANLIDLVSDVRTEIFDAYQAKRTRDTQKRKLQTQGAAAIAPGPLLLEVQVETEPPVEEDPPIFTKKEDIPVVIMELGPWIGNDVTASRGDAPGNMINAQRKFVHEVDSNAVLVKTGTHWNPKKRLSSFYHYDAASQIIMGADLATALADHLESR